MTARSATITEGLAALAKSAIVLVAVPFAVVRLWSSSRLPRRLLDASSLTTLSFWLHLVLLVVVAIWIWASFSLSRGVATAIHLGDQAARGPWATRWAASIVGMVMLLSASSALSSARVASVHPPSVVASAQVARSTSERAAEVARQLAPNALNIASGECLDEFAERILGRADAWPALSSANMNHLQDDGRRVVDPNLLRSGWCISVPAAANPLTEPTALGNTSVGSPRPETTSSTRQASHHLEDLVITGLGVLAAAGLARRLAMLRRLGASLREPGQRPRKPPSELGELEALLRGFGGSSLVDWIDASLRLLARVCADRALEAELPEIRLVRAGPDGIEFLLEESLTPAPPPFQASVGGRWWTLPPSVGPEEARAGAGTAGRYLPWLVPVGDDGQAAYLVAIGPHRQLSILGDEELVAAAIESIVLSLRVLPWAEELEVALAGIAAPDPSEQSYHLETTSVEALIELAEGGAASDRRQAAPDWRREPLIVIGQAFAADPAVLERANRVAGIISPRPGSQVSLYLDGDGARLEPFALQLGQQLTKPRHLELVERLILECASAPEVVPIEDAVGLQRMVLGQPGPVEVRLLAGPVEVDVPLVSLSPRDRDRAIELACYLALHDHAGKAPAVARALFPAASPELAQRQLRHVYGALRAGLHRDNRRPLLNLAGDVLSLDSECTSDWARFISAARCARSCPPDEAMDLLHKALELVRSRPFATTLAGYRWIVSEGLYESIGAEIVDAAHHLAVLALAGGDLALARFAADKGRLIEPASEMLARDLMAIHDASGEQQLVEKTFVELADELNALGANEPTVETRAYYEQLSTSQPPDDAPRSN